MKRKTISKIYFKTRHQKAWKNVKKKIQEIKDGGSILYKFARRGLNSTTPSVLSDLARLLFWGVFFFYLTCFHFEPNTVQILLSNGPLTHNQGSLHL